MRGATRPLSIGAVGSPCHPGHVSSSRHIARRMRLSRTPRSCTCHHTGDVTSQAGAAFDDGCRRTSSASHSPPTSESHRLFHRFVSSTDAIHATGLLTLTPVGRTPTEQASLRWTHGVPKTAHFAQQFALSLVEANHPS